VLMNCSKRQSRTERPYWPVGEFLGRALAEVFRLFPGRCPGLICGCPFYEKRRSVKSTSNSFFPSQLTPYFKIVSISP
jgi:hypothetical protein